MLSRATLAITAVVFGSSDMDRPKSDEEQGCCGFHGSWDTLSQCSCSGNDLDVWGSLFLGKKIAHSVQNNVSSGLLVRDSPKLVARLQL